MLKILIVDDSEVDRLLMEGLLKQSIGFEVIWAENGRQALDRIEEWKVDIVVTDLQMPEMDGLGIGTTGSANPPAATRYPDNRSGERAYCGGSTESRCCWLCTQTSARQTAGSNRT